MLACVSNVSFGLIGFVRAFSLSLCCLLACISVPALWLFGGVLRDRLDNQLSSLDSTSSKYLTEEG
jgi:hypothetical protein